MSQIKSGIILSYASLALNNLIAILYTPVLLRYLGQSEYGLYSLITAIIAYLTILDFGLGNTIVRYAALYRTQGEMNKLYNLYGLFMKIYVGISLIVIVLGIGVHQHLESFLNVTLTAEEIRRAKIMFVLLIVNLAFTFPLTVFSSIVTAYQRFVFSKTVNIIRLALQPVIMTPLLIWGYKAITLVVVITVLNLGGLLAQMIYCFVKLKIKVKFGRTDSSIIREVIVFSFFIFLGIAVDRMEASTGQIILGIVRGPSTVAIYAIVMQIVFCFFAFASSMSGIFFPRVTELTTVENNRGMLTDLFIKVGRLQYIVLLLVLLGFIFWGRSFVLFWAGEDYLDAYRLSVILLIPLLLASIVHMGTLIVQALNRQKFRGIAFLIVSIINIIASYFLAKRYGALGCAIPYAATLIIDNIIIMGIYYQKIIRLDILRFWREILRSVPLVIVSCGMAWLISRYIAPDTIMKFGAGVVVFMAVYIVAAYIMYMNSYERGLIKRLFTRFIRH